LDGAAELFVFGSLPSSQQAGSMAQGLFKYCRHAVKTAKLRTTCELQKAGSHWKLLRQHFGFQKN